MSAEDHLYAALSAYAPLQALVDDRVYPDYVPQKIQLPAVAFARVETEFINTLSQLAVASKATIEVVSMAATRSAADAVALACQQGCIDAGFPPANRRTDFDADRDIWATVITVDIWE